MLAAINRENSLLSWLNEVSTAVQEVREGKWNKMAECRDLEVARDWEMMRERRCHCVWGSRMSSRLCLTFVGPCILIYFYSKTNQMHNISNLFYFGTTFYMFRTVSPSIIRSLRLYIQHQVYVIQVLWLLASEQPQNPYGMMLYVQS